MPLSTLRSPCLCFVSLVISNPNLQGMTDYISGVRRMILLRWHEGSDSDRVTGLNRDEGLVGHCKIPAGQRAKLPRYWREGAVEVRPFPAEKRLGVSEAQGLSVEAMKGNPTTTVIPGVDESKPSPRTTDDPTEPQNQEYQGTPLCSLRKAFSTPPGSRRPSIS